MINKIKQQKLPSHIQFDTVSQATKLLEKRRILYEVNEAFESQKALYLQNEENFRKQENCIRQRDSNIQTNLINFCKFLQENEARKLRALKRQIDEQNIRECKQKEINELQIQCIELQKYQDQLDEKLNSLKKHGDYLNQVIQISDKYQDIPQILSLYQKLTTSYLELNKKNQQTEEEYENLKQQSILYEKNQNQDILQLNNDIKDLTKKLEVFFIKKQIFFYFILFYLLFFFKKKEKINERNSIQNSIEISNKQYCQLNLNFGKILMSIDNQYEKCTDKKKSKNNENFLDFIQENQKEKKIKEIGKKKDQKVKRKTIVQEEDFDEK
ncbi:hypothetical protein IMG5_014590, partial [Ichthyophthirius multifiliis]